jgi:Uma2 family endonuclease
MSNPLARPYITYEELCLLPDDGHRYELFDGEAYMCPSPSFWHQKLLLRLGNLFSTAIGRRGEVFIAPMDVVLGPATVPQPDLGVILAEHTSIIQDVVRGVPDLVLEILSRSTAAMDRGLKKQTYARHGIPEYWIVVPEQEAIEIYRLDRAAGAYRLTETCRRGDRATTPLLPALSVDVTELFAK